MIRGWRKLLLILSLVMPLLQAYATEVYLLSKPITRVDKVTNQWLMGNFAIDMAFRASSIGMAYYTTGSKTVAAGVAIDGLLSQIPATALNPRFRLQVWSGIKTRKNIKEIADLPGVTNIRLLTSGQMDNHDYFHATLYSRSMVFVETDGAPPPKIEASEWIHLKDLANAKLNLNLTIGNEPIGSPVEISIDQLFKGTTIDSELRNEWVDKIKTWEEQFSFLQRFNPFTSFNEAMSINAKLQINGQTFDIGEIANGKSVHKMLGNSMVQRLSRTVREVVLSTPIEPQAKVKVKSADVIEEIASRDENPCSIAIKRALGTLYIRKPASN
jgi:hypothetical protein